MPLPEFRFRLNGMIMPEIDVRVSPDGESNILAMKDPEYGDWVVVDEGNENFVLEYRDETAWALLPTEMRRADASKGWNQATPEELIYILWNTGVLK